jgi:hypothetical protein
VSIGDIYNKVSTDLGLTVNDLKTRIRENYDLLFS